MIRPCIILLWMVAAGCQAHSARATNLTRPAIPGTPQMLTITFLRWEKAKKPGYFEWEAVFLLKNASAQSAWFRGTGDVRPLVARETWADGKWTRRITPGVCGGSISFRELRPGEAFEFKAGLLPDQPQTFRLSLGECCFSDDRPVLPRADLFTIHSTPAIVGNNTPSTVG